VLVVSLEAVFATCYFAVGAALATWQHWQLLQRGSLRPGDHVALLGVVLLWPLVCVALACLVVIHQALGRRP
jgi:type VI protein secretion system component VasK